MKKLVSSISISITLLATLASPAFADTPNSTFTWPQVTGLLSLGTILSRILIIIFFFAAVLAFLFIVLGGLQWIMAGGDKIAAGNARDRITSAVIGLIIVIAAFAIVVVITSALGVNIFSGTITLPGGVGFPTAP
jgi:hypothetical protein